MSAFSKELRSFLIVSQSGSIREAASRMNISAPALSRQMQILERSYGVQLLVRSAGGIALTSEGASLQKEAQKWMNADTAFSQSLQRTNQKTGLFLRLGIMEGLVDPIILRLVSALEEHFGSVELDLVVGSTSILMEKSEALDIDLIVAYNMPRLSRLVVFESFEYHLGACYSPKLGIDGTGPIQMQEALQWPLCLPSSALSMHTRLMAEILGVRVNPKVALSSNSISTLMAFLREGKGITFLPWPDVSQDVEAGRLAFRSIESKRLTETLSLAICRGNSLGDATGLVLQEIRKIIESLGK